MTQKTTDQRLCHILVVEDEILVAMNLCMEFETHGAHIIGPAGTLAHASELVDASPIIDVAVLDVHLSGEEVFPVADKLIQRNVPLIFHTGHEKEKNLNDRYPGMPVFIKPGNIENLIRRTLDSVRSP